MEFMKYPSIENSYRSKHIERWVSYFPQLLTERYLLTEKIHGSNFSVMIDEDTVEFAKKSAKLGITEKFFDYQNTVKKYDNEFLLAQEYIKANDEISTIRLFAEIFGGGIQKGVFYGDEKRLRVFDCWLNEELLPQCELIELLKTIGIYHMFVPFIAIVDSLEEALSYNTVFNSKLHDSDDNICEGLVIKPYDKVFKYGDGSIFYIKNKNKEFSEKKSAPKVNFVPSEQLESAQHEYSLYLTKNRLDGIMSKHGEIDTDSQMGEYIKYMTTDAREDYLKDNMEQFLELEDKERGKLFSISGKVIVPMLREYL